MTKSKQHTIHKYRQGKGWIVSEWNSHYGAWVLSDEVNYWTACSMIREAKAEAKQRDARAKSEGGA